MALQFYPLYTDVLIYLQIAVIVAGVVYVRRHEHLITPWRRVAQSKSGMIGLIVLLMFASIGVLDSVHFRQRVSGAEATGKARYSPDVISLLDLSLNHLRQQREKTYSAPLAAVLFTQESVETADGTPQRSYPRLKYGGAHLKNPDSERDADITREILKGAMWGTVVSLLIALATIVYVARTQHESLTAAYKRIWRGETHVPWHVILLTVLVLSLIVGVLTTLSGGYHVFGTDKVGQDVLYVALKSVRTGLVIGTLTTLLMLPFALALGIAAGYFGGWVDDVIQYSYTVLNSIPGVLLIAAAVLMMQVQIDRYPEWFPTAAQRADLRLLFLCVILGVTSWTSLCRLLRGETLKLKELEYIQAAHAFGVRSHRIIIRHILPNVMYLVLINTVMGFSGLVLAEAVLSYVGVGVDPSMNSFGTMINNARLEMAREPMVWWSLAAAFAFMVVLVLAANLFADAVRDAFDPRVRRLNAAQLQKINADDEDQQAGSVA